MNRKIILIDGEVWFTGFRWRHSGREKTGRLEAGTSRDSAMLLTDSQVPQAKKDLESLGIGNYKVYSIYPELDL